MYSTVKVAEDLKIPHGCFGPFKRLWDRRKTETYLTLKPAVEKKNIDLPAFDAHELIERDTFKVRYLYCSCTSVCLATGGSERWWIYNKNFSGNFSHFDDFFIYLFINFFFFCVVRKFRYATNMYGSTQPTQLRFQFQNSKKKNISISNQKNKINVVLLSQSMIPWITF